MKYKCIGYAVLFVLFSAQANVYSQEQEEQEEQQSMTAFLQYEVQKNDPWGPLALNFLVGFGVGSFVQGDTTAGLLLAGGDVLGIGLLLAGWGIAVDAAARSDTDAAGTAGVVALAGWLTLTAARIGGIIAPFSYANSFNEKLKRDLGISVSDVSLIVPGGQLDGYGVRVTVKMEQASS